MEQTLKCSKSRRSLSSTCVLIISEFKQLLTLNVINFSHLHVFLHKVGSLLSQCTKQVNDRLPTCDISRETSILVKTDQK